MVDKVSGHVEYAVMAYGGFLRMCERYFPLPWQTLDYDTRRGGYRIDMTERDLESALSLDRNSQPSFHRRYGTRHYRYAGLSSGPGAQPRPRRPHPFASPQSPSTVIWNPSSP